MATLQLLKRQRDRFEPIIRELNAWLGFIASGLALLYVTAFLALHVPPLPFAADSADPMPQITYHDALASGALQTLNVLP